MLSLKNSVDDQYSPEKVAGKLVVSMVGLAVLRFSNVSTSRNVGNRHVVDPAYPLPEFSAFMAAHWLNAAGQPIVLREPELQVLPLKA